MKDKLFIVNKCTNEIDYTVTKELKNDITKYTFNEAGGYLNPKSKFLKIEINDDDVFMNILGTKINFAFYEFAQLKMALDVLYADNPNYFSNYMTLKKT
jgi:hypothetical protein